MKKLFTCLMAMCSIGFTKANPIAAPPVISEFYLVDESHWYLELVFVKSFPFNLSTLDGCTITTSTGTFSFKSGIQVIPDSIIVITQNSLQTPLKINRKGDFILIKRATPFSYEVDRLYFGNTANSQISASQLGQSIVNYGFSCWNSLLGRSDIQYHKVKDNHPTIGFNAFKPYNVMAATTMGIFTGIVYDKERHPVRDIHVGDSYYFIPHSGDCRVFFWSTLSDSLGRFSIPEYSGRYYASLFFNYPRILSSSYINIEPDSLNYYEFTIDTLLTNVKSNLFKTNINLSCFPNPSTGETNISFGIPEGGHYSKALVKIYDSNGEMTRILPVNINSPQNRCSVKWDGICYDNSLASGIYFCSLELDERKAGTTKIIIAK